MLHGLIGQFPGPLTNEVGGGYVVMVIGRAPSDAW